MALTAARLRELYDYCPDTGLFLRRVATGPGKSGPVVSRPNKNGYLRLCIDYVLYMQHRLAWLHVNGTLPTVLIDHINGNKQDNRIANLRLADQALNQLNRHRAHPLNRTGLIGAHAKRDGTFTADIRINGSQVRIGVFGTAVEAHEAYLAAKATEMERKDARVRLHAAVQG